MVAIYRRAVHMVLSEKTEKRNQKYSDQDDDLRADVQGPGGVKER